MKNKQFNIDCMKYRKSTHLAGVDVEMIISDKGKCNLTIKEAYYDRGVDVSGNKTDGYFIDFVEDVKPMVVNSGKKKTISHIVKMKDKCSAMESRNTGNWKGISIELIFDPNVKMMGQVVGGIKVSPKSPIPEVNDVKALELMNSSKNKEELKDNWAALSKDEQKLPSVNSLKDQLKNDLQ